MRRLSVRQRDAGTFEVGPAGHGPSVMVSARDRHDALKRGKELLRSKHLLVSAAEASYRDNKGMKTRPAASAAAESR